MRRFLEEGIPLIDLQRDANSVALMLTHPSFGEYRDIVLDLLRSHGKITQIDYVQHRASMFESRAQGKPMSINVGELGVLAIGPSTNLKEGPMTIFDQRGQQVAYQWNAAGDINFGSVQNKAEFISELEKVKAELKKAADSQVVDAEVVTDTDYQITKVIQQANKSEPDKRSILEHLSKAKGYVKGITDLAGLATMLTKAVELAQHLF